MNCLTERENQWSLIFSVRYRKLNEIYLHYLLRYLPSWQFGSPVWSLQGSCPLLLTAHILLCIWPAQKRSHKISHVTNTATNLKVFYINYLNRTYSWYNNTTTSEKKNHMCTHITDGILCLGHCHYLLVAHHPWIPGLLLWELRLRLKGPFIYKRQTWPITNVPKPGNSVSCKAFMNLLNKPCNSFMWNDTKNELKY